MNYTTLPKNKTFFKPRNMGTPRNLFYENNLNTRALYCTNCGKYGHEYKYCSDAVISTGVILLRFDYTNIKNLFYNLTAINNTNNTTNTNNTNNTNNTHTEQTTNAIHNNKNVFDKTKYRFYVKKWLWLICLLLCIIICFVGVGLIVSLSGILKK